uniref:Uncharacterized protein n=1 Tax=Micrurus corallinus TaxID=54390 RepID=A0A2D4EKP5_MICCO
MVEFFWEAKGSVFASLDNVRSTYLILYICFCGDGGLSFFPTERSVWVCLWLVCLVCTFVYVVPCVYVHTDARVFYNESDFESLLWALTRCIIFLFKNLNAKPKYIGYSQYFASKTHSILAAFPRFFFSLLK